MSAFALKIIAIIVMTMNHITHSFGDKMPDLVYYIFVGVGGLTFPIMAYLMAEGYKYTRSVKKYGLRLFIFGLLALVPFFICVGGMFNVLFTFLLGLIVIYLNDNMKSRVGFWIIFIIITLLTVFCDWPLMGVPMILCYHRIKNKYLRVIVPVIFPWVVFGSMVISGILFTPDMLPEREIISNALFAFGGCTASIPILLSYNGEKGRSMKYLFYAYYPAHLAVIGILKLLYK